MKTPIKEELIQWRKFVQQDIDWCLVCKDEDYPCRQCLDAAIVGGHLDFIIRSLDESNMVNRGSYKAPQSR